MGSEYFLHLSAMATAAPTRLLLPSSLCLMAIMQRLYDSEISAVVYSFYDCGFRVLLGNRLNGYLVEACCGMG